jgi:hypothetical protein
MANKTKPFAAAPNKKQASSNVLKNISLLTQDFEPIAVTNRKASILASDIAMQVSGSAFNEYVDNSRYNADTLMQIYNNMLPSYMSWDF